MEKEPKPGLSDSEKSAISKERIQNSADLIKKGAKVTPDEQIFFTHATDQMVDAKVEMGDEMYKKYKEAQERNAYLQEIVDQRIVELEKEINELYQKLFELNNNSDKIEEIKCGNKEYDTAGGAIEGLRIVKNLRDIFNPDNIETDENETASKQETEQDIIQKRIQIISRSKKIIDNILKGRKLVLIEYGDKKKSFLVLSLVRKIHRTFKHEMLNQEFTIEEMDTLRENFLPAIKDAIFSIVPEKSVGSGSSYLELIEELLEELYEDAPKHMELFDIAGWTFTNEEMNTLKEKLLPAIKSILLSVVPKNKLGADTDYVVLTKKLLEEFYGDQMS